MQPQQQLCDHWSGAGLHVRYLGIHRQPGKRICTQVPDLLSGDPCKLNLDPGVGTEMTQDDLNNDPVTNIFDIYTGERKVKDAGMAGPAETVEIQTSISLALWNDALASGDDALVLIQWLESNRSS